MSDHPSIERLGRYRNGALAPDELLAVDDHLAECAACHQRVQTLPPALVGALASALATAGPPEHVEFGTLAGMWMARSTRDRPRDR